MTTKFNTLLLSTALTLPLAAQAQAQSADEACRTLEAFVADGLPEAMLADEDRLRSVYEADDAEVCVVELTRVQASAESSAEAGAQVADTAQTTVTLQDEVTIEGMVFLDREPADVNVQSGETDVQIEPGSPSVTVTEGQAEIVVRQAPANITVDMPTPTIRIEQAAPEIIITWADPNVAVGAAQPRVEVRQADPVISVTQAPPLVELELRRAAEGTESAGIGVTDRRTGTAYAPGAGTEAIAMEDANVSFSQGEPRVTMVEPTEQASVSIEKSQPTIRFEQSEPTVQIASQGEPIIEFTQSGEPIVTFNEANLEGTDDTQTAALADTDAAAATEEATEEVVTETAETTGEITEEAEAELTTEETDMASTETDTDTSTVVNTETPVQMTGPMVEREGYEMVMQGDVDFASLEGRSVYGINDEDIGEIGNLILNDQGVVQSVIIEVGGFLGLGEKHVEMPFSEMSVLQSADGDVRLYVEATEEQLEGMPEYVD